MNPRLSRGAAAIDKMTYCDYHIVMIPVNIAVLKSKLSFYLGQVKQGHEVLVMDRNTPVARMLPTADRGRGLPLVKAKKSPASLKAMRFHPPKRKTNVVELLREERDLR